MRLDIIFKRALLSKDMELAAKKKPVNLALEAKVAIEVAVKKEIWNRLSTKFNRR